LFPNCSGFANFKHVHIDAMQHSQIEITARQKPVSTLDKGAGTRGQSPRDFLQSELKRKQSINPHFSLRAYARQLGISPGRLSEILHGKRPITKKQALSVLPKLCLSSRDQTAFLDAVDQFRMKRKAIKVQQSHLKKQIADVKDLSHDAFMAIAEWQNFAIYSLLECVWKSEKTTQAIAKKLGLTLDNAQNSLERMERLGMVEKSLSGEWNQIKNSWIYSVDSAAFRKAHVERLLIAARAVEEVHKDEREIAAVNLAFNRAKLPKAKAMIQKFWKDFAAEMEIDPGEDVYALQVQFYPLTNGIQTQGNGE